MKTILIVEDDRSINMGLAKNLKYEGYQVLSAEDGERGLRLAVDRKPDAIVLDVMLPGASGFEVCRSLRRARIHTPILILTARDQEVDKVMGLDLGADDYLTKPFDLAELKARARALMRRSDKRIAGTVTVGSLELDSDARLLRRDGTDLDLPRRSRRNHLQLPRGAR